MYICSKFSWDGENIKVLAKQAIISPSPSHAQNSPARGLSQEFQSFSLQYCSDAVDGCSFTMM